MKKNSLLRYDNSIIRILEIKDNQALIINCTKKSMPKWIDKSKLNCNVCSEEELQQETNMILPDIESLDIESKRFIHEHYTLIACILPFISNEKERNYMISNISKIKNISKQTIRHYLCLYLIYQNISALAPKQKTKIETLTQDEKNIRWALNKFYYTKNQNSLNTAYTLMLKAKYCDNNGSLLPEYPSIHQFKYFYRKHKNLQTYYISRNGLRNYQRNNRPLLGDGIQEFASNIGVGMLDATICDIYLINESGNVVGRPILTACVDAYSGLCCGYSLSWKGGMYSLKNLMTNIISDKVQWCKQFGISITHEEWNCKQLPATFITDMGSEYKSENFEQLTELGVSIINLPPYRPELKGAVEKFFDLIQECYKKHLKGKGVIEADFQERGSHDYRKDACLTMLEFEKIILHCIIYYNSKRIIENFPYTEDMISTKVQPYSNCIWNWGMSQIGANLISIDYDTLIFSLLPRTIGKFNRNGLKVNQLRYKNDNYTEMYLKGGTVTVAYNPDDVSEVWLIDNNKYIKFELIESRFKNKELSEVLSVKTSQKNIIKSVTDANIQAQIDLAKHIETIAITSKNVNYNDTNIKEIRKTRKAEQNKTHIDFIKGGVTNV